MQRIDPMIVTQSLTLCLMQLPVPAGGGLTGGAHSADFASESSEFDTSDDEFLADLQPLRNIAKLRRVDTSNVDSDENVCDTVVMI